MIRPSHSFARSGALTLDRLNALTDGVMAIVITLLVLEIEIPKDHNFSQDGLSKFFGRIEHDVVVYAATFWLVGCYWIQHHTISHYLRCGDRPLIWLNLLYLFPVSLLPFAADLKSAYKQEILPVIVFGVVHIACGLTLAVLWLYAANHPALLTHSVRQEVKRSLTCRILVGPFLGFVAIGLSFYSVRLGTYAFLMAPFFHLSHQLADTQWKAHGAAARA